ncbi:MAG: hypothetical protein LIP08_13015 [Bacteroides sp.]|nr:hypothetical protein [Bacteroides sp.]
MPVNNGIITAPISVDDVRQCLGVSSNDVGYLCSNQHKKINIWSKFKPINYRSYIGQSYNSTDENYIAGMWKGEQGNCGLSLPQRVSTSGTVIERANRIRGLYEEGDNDYLWASWYEPPTGGGNSPFRLLDFWGYNHEASPFVVRSGDSYEFDVTGSATYLRILFTADAGDSSDTLQSYDLEGADVNLNDFRLVCAVFSYNGSLAGIYSASQNILVNGEIKGTWIDLPLKELFASLQSQFTAKLYFAMQNTAESSYANGYYRLPESLGTRVFNLSPVDCKILWNTDFIVENKGSDVLVANWDMVLFRPWREISSDDEGDMASVEKYYLCSTDDVTTKLTIKNPSSTASSTNISTISLVGSFNLGAYTLWANYVYDENMNRISTIDIPANGKTTIIIRWPNFFANARAHSQDNGDVQNIEVRMYKSGAYIVGGDIWYKYKYIYPNGFEQVK